MELEPVKRSDVLCEFSLSRDQQVKSIADSFNLTIPELELQVYAWAAVIAAAYFAGALLLPREIRQARDLRNEKHGRVGSDEALRSQTRST